MQSPHTNRESAGRTESLSESLASSKSVRTKGTMEKSNVKHSSQTVVSILRLLNSMLKRMEFESQVDLTAQASYKSQRLNL